MAGEVEHAKGAAGARRAKEWLDATTRVNAQYVVPNPIAVPKLTFPWAGGSAAAAFSFDLGGFLLGGDLQGEEFLAECKFYASHGDQGTEYAKFVGKCYCAYKHRPERCDNFMWITWAPFLVTRWPELCTMAYVREQVLAHRARTVATGDEQEAETLVDDEVCQAVADRLWIIVLSERQESLVISKEHRGVIQAHEAQKGAGS